MVNKKLKVNWVAITTYCMNNGISYWIVKRKLDNWQTIEEALVDSDLKVSRLKVEIPKKKKFELKDVIPDFIRKRL